jgi:hypothetical protein
MAWGRTTRELAEVLTAADLAEYQALVEIDGPWWGEREAAHLRQLCALQAAAGGTDSSPDDWEIEWQVGPADAPDVNLLAPEDGIKIMAAGFGLAVEEVPRG